MDGDIGYRILVLVVLIDLLLDITDTIMHKSMWCSFSYDSDRGAVVVLWPILKVCKLTHCAHLQI